jgi:creatinine amidohydrolase/Fe(II)-dependent formamide hydrolase-like protein
VRRVALIAIALAALAAGSRRAAAQSSVFLEELTWTEVRGAIHAGKTTVIVPTGGTEQNGPHMVLGKHNIIVRFTAGEIARRLGDALVAPVVAYVPEGEIAPPSGHMWAPGTITLPEECFARLLESAARGFRAQGFTDVALIGDSGGSQAAARAVADRLNREWASTPARVHAIDAYYAGNGFEDWLRRQGESSEDIGTHAGLADTSQLLAIDPEGVRRDRLAAGRAGDGSGVDGNPARASAEYGRKGLELKIEAAVSSIRALRERASRRAP